MCIGLDPVAVGSLETGRPLRSPPPDAIGQDELNPRFFLYGKDDIYCRLYSTYRVAPIANLFDGLCKLLFALQNVDLFHFENIYSILFKLSHFVKKHKR
jgi:hypothetical protein